MPDLMDMAKALVAAEADRDKWWERCFKFGELAIVQQSRLNALRALIRRAHDAMSRREPDGISTEAWDQLVADMAKELGVASV